MKIFGIAAVLFKIFSEIENEIIDRSGSWINIITPYGLQYLFPWHHFIFIFDQQFQQHGLFLAQLYLFTFFGRGFLGFEINGILSESIGVANG